MRRPSFWPPQENAAYSLEQMFVQQDGREIPRLQSRDFSPTFCNLPAGRRRGVRPAERAYSRLIPAHRAGEGRGHPLVPPIAGEFSIGHAVASKAAVDALLAQAAAAGAALTDQHHDRPWGIYSGYFRDLDGHLWEVLWNPELEDI